MGLFKQDNQDQNQNQETPSVNITFDPFAAVAGADVGYQKNPYFSAGVYPVLALDVMKMTTSRQNELFFIAEFEIIKSNVEDLPAGMRATWMANFRHDATPGNVRGFIATLMGVTPEEVDADSVKFACSPKNPCFGRLIKLEASMTKTKKGGDFTVHNWFEIPADVQAQSEELRKEAGFGTY